MFIQTYPKRKQEIISDSKSWTVLLERKGHFFARALQLRNFGIPLELAFKYVQQWKQLAVWVNCKISQNFVQKNDSIEYLI